MIIAETERLVLRHFHIADLNDLNRLFSDPEVMQFGPGIQTAQWVQNWLENCFENYYGKWGFGPWAVIEKHCHTTIGYCGLFYFPNINGQAEIEIGYRLVQTFWGHGYATEAAIAVRDYSFAVLTLPRLIAMIDPQNTASIRVAEKIGMRYDKDIIFEGYTHADNIYLITNPSCE